MKGLGTLIRLHKRRVDLIRRDIAGLEEQKGNLRALGQRLVQELDQERVKASQDILIAGFFPSYARVTENKIVIIYNNIKKLDEEINKKLEEMRGEFSDQKRYEIALAQRKKHVKQQAEKREQQRFDETAISQYLKESKESL